MTTKEKLSLLIKKIYRRFDLSSNGFEKIRAEKAMFNQCMDLCGPGHRRRMERNH